MQGGGVCRETPGQLRSGQGGFPSTARQLFPMPCLGPIFWEEPGAGAPLRFCSPWQTAMGHHQIASLLGVVVAMGQSIKQINPPQKKPNPKVRLLQLSSGWQMAHLKAVQMSNFEVMVLAAEPAPSDGLYVFCPGVVQMRIKDMSLLNEGVIASNGRTFKNLIENN